ncbi:alpha/beta fold hydrolase [Actinoplanes sp. NPDC051346]|uniref:dienelactone hydrolase family protein n=1 Tax=Actinoplanes sp. NPDC051346 TaxID=3155048 RepID=UPI003415249B
MRADAANLRPPADVVLPERASGVVVFAHGTGSSRHSPRNRMVAAELNRRGLGTVLVDLHTPEEESTAEEAEEQLALSADRLIGVVDWLTEHGPTADLEIGLFGASRGAAAALIAAAARPDPVRAVVCRGGRPDLAGPALIEVSAPTLLLVGERDERVMALNQQARATMTVTAELRVVPGATQLFAEPGALEQVAAEAGAWFDRYLEPRRTR